MNDPTTTGLETTDFPIWNIDFPGVTICPNTKVEMYFLHNLIYWRHHLHKNQGENVFLKKVLFSIVGNEQVQGSTDKSKSPLGKAVEGGKCHPGTGDQGDYLQMSFKPIIIFDILSENSDDCFGQLCHV